MNLFDELTAERDALKEKVRQLHAIIDAEAKDSAEVIIERDSLAVQNQELRAAIAQAFILQNDRVKRAYVSEVLGNALALPDLATDIPKQRDAERLNAIGQYKSRGHGEGCEGNRHAKSSFKQNKRRGL